MGMTALVVALQGEPITGERDPPDRAQQRLGQPPELQVRTAAICQRDRSWLAEGTR
jgi:hypothetical protein